MGLSPESVAAKEKRKVCGSSVLLGEVGAWGRVVSGAGGSRLVFKLGW